MSTQTKKTDITTNKPVITANEKSLATIQQNYSNLVSIENAKNVISGLDTLSKSAYVHTSLIIAQIMNSVPKKERGEKRKELEIKLAKRKSMIYNYATAGNKILDGIKNGELKTIDDMPATIVEFLATDPKPSANTKIVIGEKQGEYTLKDLPHIFSIYVGSLHNANTKAIKTVYFSTTEKLKTKTEIIIQSGLIEKTDGTHSAYQKYFSGDKEISIKLIPLQA